MGSVLIVEKDTKQLPIHFVSRELQGTELLKLVFLILEEPYLLPKLITFSLDGNQLCQVGTQVAKATGCHHQIWSNLDCSVLEMIRHMGMRKEFQ